MVFLANVRRYAAVVIASAALFGATALPATAHAADNFNVVSIQTPAPNAEEVRFSAVRYANNAADPVELSIIESEDEVIITAVSAAAGGFNAIAPCYKGSTHEARCPKVISGTASVKSVRATAPVGDNGFTIDTPTLAVSVSLGNGDDMVSVLNCTTSSITADGGDDTIYGGTGVDTISADGGTDYIYVYSSPAGADTVYCGSPAVESPSDTVIVDANDTVNYSANCLSVTAGP